MNIVESPGKASPGHTPALQRPSRGGESVEKKLRPARRSAHPGYQPQIPAGTGAVVPAYRIHRTKQLGYVRLNKHMLYLGKANTPESFECYRRVLGEWLVCRRVPARGRWDASPSLTVAALADAPGAGAAARGRATQ